MCEHMKIKFLHDKICNVCVLEISDRGRHQSDISGLEKLLFFPLLGGCYGTL